MQYESVKLMYYCPEEENTYKFKPTIKTILIYMLCYNSSGH